MPQAFTLSDKARKAAIVKADATARVTKLSFLHSDDSFKSWKVGDSMDVYADLIRYSDKVAPLISKLTREYVKSTDRTALATALGAMQRELRKATRNDKASLCADKAAGPIILDESEDGKPVTRFIVKRTA